MISIRECLDREAMALYPDQVLELLTRAMDEVMENTDETIPIMAFSFAWNGQDRYKFIAEFPDSSGDGYQSELDICIPEDREKNGGNKK